MFFHDWNSIVRLLVMTPLAYLSMLMLLRASGNRTLSKLHAFDFVVTIALGSCLATVILSKDVTLAEGAVAFALLIMMQLIVALVIVHVPRSRSWLEGEAVLLFHKGNFLPVAMRSARVTVDDVKSSVRAQGVKDMQQVSAVVMETDGSLSVIRQSSDENKMCAADDSFADNESFSQSTLSDLT